MNAHDSERIKGMLESLGLEGPSWRVPAYHSGEGHPLLEASAQQGLIRLWLSSRGVLAQTLRERGAKVDYCELYMRQRPPQALFNLGTALSRADSSPCSDGLCLGPLPTHSHSLLRGAA